MQVPTSTTCQKRALGFLNKFFELFSKYNHSAVRRPFKILSHLNCSCLSGMRDTGLLQLTTINSCLSP